MTEADYLRLKIVTLEFKNVTLRAEQVAKDARAKFNEALLRAGLDPTLDYIMDDAAMTIVPVPKIPKEE